MAPEDDAEDITEHNQYRETLIRSKTTVIGCGNSVYDGYGSPLDAIATPVADGGWVCTEADAWVTEMKETCAGITEAFDQAVSHIATRIGDEPVKVEENDWRGNAWSRTWAHRRNF